MANEELWTAQEETNWPQPKRSFNALRLSLLFATAAVALAVVATPMLAGKTVSTIAYSDTGFYDDVITGSIATTREGIQRTPNFPTKSYTIRRSITQSSGDACVIFDNGLKSGNC